jgi:hypothetical protein
MICDSASVKLGEDGGLLAEILHILLTYDIKLNFKLLNSKIYMVYFQTQFNGRSNIEQSSPRLPQSGNVGKIWRPLFPHI